MYLLPYLPVNPHVQRLSWETPISDLKWRFHPNKHRHEAKLSVQMIGKLQQGIEGRRKHQEQLCRRLHLLQFDQVCIDYLIILETISLGNVKVGD